MERLGLVDGTVFANLRNVGCCYAKTGTERESFMVVAREYDSVKQRHIGLSA